MLNYRINYEKKSTAAIFLLENLIKKEHEYKDINNQFMNLLVMHSNSRDC
jgi:hypothetical protein